MLEARRQKHLEKGTVHDIATWLFMDYLGYDEEKWLMENRHDDFDKALKEARELNEEFNAWCENGGVNNEN